MNWSCSCGGNVARTVSTITASISGPVNHSRAIWSKLRSRESHQS